MQGFLHNAEFPTRLRHGLMENEFAFYFVPRKDVTELIYTIYVHFT